MSQKVSIPLPSIVTRWCGAGYMLKSISVQASRPLEGICPRVGLVER
jgi:hypothetical protein